MKIKKPFTNISVPGYESNENPCRFKLKVEKTNLVFQMQILNYPIYWRK